MKVNTDAIDPPAVGKAYKENLEPSSQSRITARVTRSQARAQKSLPSLKAVKMASNTFQRPASIKAATASRSLRKRGKQGLATDKSNSASHPQSFGHDKTRGTVSIAAEDGKEHDYNDLKERRRKPPPSKDGLMDHPSDSYNESEDGRNSSRGRRNPKSSPFKDYLVDELEEDRNADDGNSMAANYDNGSESTPPALSDIDNDLALVPRRSVDDNNTNHSFADQTHTVAASSSPPRSAGTEVFDTSELYARILDLDGQARVMSTQLAATMELLKRQQTNLERHGDRIDRHETHLIEARKDIGIHNENLAKQLDLNKAKVDMMNSLINMTLRQGKGKRGRDGDSRDEGYDFAPRKKHLTQAQAPHLTTSQKELRAKQPCRSPLRRSRSPQPTRCKSLKAITEPDYDEDSDTSGSGVDVTDPVAKEIRKHEGASFKEPLPALRTPPGSRPVSARNPYPFPLGTAVSDCDRQADVARRAEIAAARHGEARRRAAAARRDEFDGRSKDPYSSLTAAQGIINPSSAQSGRSKKTAVPKHLHG